MRVQEAYSRVTYHRMVALPSPNCKARLTLLFAGMFGELVSAAKVIVPVTVFTPPEMSIVISAEPSKRSRLCKQLFSPHRHVPPYSYLIVLLATGVSGCRVHRQTALCRLPACWMYGNIKERGIASVDAPHKAYHIGAFLACLGGGVALCASSPGAHASRHREHPVWRFYLLHPVCGVSVGSDQRGTVCRAGAVSSVWRGTS